MRMISVKLFAEMMSQASHRTLYMVDGYINRWYYHKLTAKRVGEVCRCWQYTFSMLSILQKVGRQASVLRQGDVR